nr:hypothetical protein CFP56_09251 [Quercus suber]
MHQSEAQCKLHTMTRYSCNIFKDERTVRSECIQNDSCNHNHERRIYGSALAYRRDEDQASQNSITIRPTEMAIIDIKIFSDTICPWGLQRAIALFKKTYPGAASDTFNLIWLPYYLDANGPTPGVPMHERIVAKNGADRASGIKSRLQRVGRAHDIEFSFAGKVANTRDSHRLIHAAGLQSTALQTALVEQLFHDHFEKAADPSLHADLMEAATAAGMAHDEVVKVLQSDAWGKEVDELEKESRALGLTSVPTFNISGKIIEGAEDPSEFYEAFVEARHTASAAKG